MSRIIVRKTLLSKNVLDIDLDILSQSLFKILDSDFGALSTSESRVQLDLIEKGQLENNTFKGIYQDQDGKEFTISILNGVATINR